MTTDVERHPKYRWIILGIACLACGSLAWSHFLIPSLEYCLFPELGLTHTQFTLIFIAPTLVCTFTAIPGGALADRYGVRRIVAIGLFVAGISGFSRVFISNLEEMVALMCLLGVAFAFVIPNLPKLVGIWFPPEEIGLASGIYTTAFASGSSLGLLTGPLFGDWKQAFTYVGIFTLVIAIIWSLFSRTAPKGMKLHIPPMISGIKKGVKSKNVWLLSAAIFLFFGVYISVTANLPKAFIDIHHVSPQVAGSIASLFTWGVAVGHLFIPMLSDKVGLRKPFLYGCPVISAICLFLAWHLAPSGCALIFLGGFAMGGITPVLLALLVELPEIGHEYLGGASGLVMTSGNAGGFFLPRVVLSPLVAAGILGAYTRGFSVVLVLLAVIALVAIPLNETGVRRTK